MPTPNDGAAPRGGRERSTPRTWLVTGCSTGFGRELALELIERGEQVVVTARKPEAIEDIAAEAPDRTLAIALDVTKEDEIAAAVAATQARFGRIDILVNNAGWVLVGGVEEAADRDIRAIFDTNFFGAVAMMQAVLPVMRQQRSGHVINISSMAGIVGFPGMGYYCATKFALAGVSEALALEGAPLGIKVTIVEPGGHRTKAIMQALHAPKTIGEYESVASQRQRMQEIGGHEIGSARLAVQAIIAAADAEQPPLHLPLGADALTRVDQKIELLAAERDRWREVILSTQLPA